MPVTDACRPAAGRPMNPRVSVAVAVYLSTTLSLADTLIRLLLAAEG